MTAGDAEPISSTEASIEVIDALRTVPQRVVPAALDPLLPALPLGEMLPDDFEKLLLKIAEEVEGLRDVRQYGLPGQRQDGLDVIGRALDGRWEGWQGKRYRDFGPADLTDAVRDYTDGLRGFPVRRLVIGVRKEKVSTAVSRRLRDLQEAHPDLDIDLYDGARITRLLRSRRDIVTVFFGPQTADRFCLPEAERAHVVGLPAAERADLADAAVRSPERTSGADVVLARAVAHAAAGEHGLAAAEYARAAQLLAAAGFRGHADAVLQDQATASARAGDWQEAARLLSGAFWRLADAGDDRSALRVLDHVRRMTRPPGATGPVEPDPAVRLLRYADAAGALLQHPLGIIGPTMADLLGDPPAEHRHELARLAALAAETALVDQDADWLSENAVELESLAEEHRQVDELLAVRLRLAAADGTGDWQQLLAAARRRQHPRIMCALIMGRYARHLATSPGNVEAGAAWTEAVELSCLDGHNQDAADWVYAVRMARIHFEPITDVTDEHVLAQALAAQAGRPRLLTPSHDVLAAGLADLHDDKLAAAVRSLRQQVRISAATGRWQDEHIARRRLAEAYRRSGEHDLAALHALAVGEKQPVEEIAEAAGEYLVDVTDLLEDGPYWQRAAALQLTSAQADLLPDGLAEQVAEHTLDVLAAAAAGTLEDRPHMFAGPSVFLRAHTLLGELASRLRTDQAERLLDALRPYAHRDPDHYHHTDDDHVQSLAAIADTHPDLREDATEQLLTMLKGQFTSTGPVLRQLDETLLRHGRHLAPQLTELAADGSHHAARLLTDLQDEPDDAQLQRARTALDRLTAPVEMEPGVISYGTGAGSDAALVTLLPGPDRSRAAHALADAAQGPEPAANRSERILAAAQLVAPLPDTLPPADAQSLLDTALAAAAAAPQATPADLATAGLDHPLSAMRMTLGDIDVRPQWMLLAARVASTPQELGRVRQQILALLAPGTGDGAWYLAQALRALPPQTLASDAPLLATHPHWAVRSVAALAWTADTDPSSAPLLGTVLARDPDQRVRRTLADALQHHGPSDRTEPARAVLAADIRYSVRRLLSS